MKFGTSLKTKSYLLMAPLVGLFLLFTAAMVHATWQLRGEVAQVEHAASDAFRSGWLVRASDRYQAHYWEFLSTGRAFDEDQIGEDAATLEKTLEQFRQESEAEGEHASAMRAQSLARDFAPAKLKVAAAARLLANTKAGPARAKAGEEGGRTLASAMAPIRDFAVESEIQVQRAAANLTATCKAIFWRSSPMCRAAEEAGVEGEEIALVQRSLRRLGAEMTALMHHAAMGAPSAELQLAHKERHAETVEGLDEVEKSEQNAQDAAGIELVNWIRERYHVVTLLSTQLANLPAKPALPRMVELEEQLETQIDSLNSAVDAFTASQAADLRGATLRLRTALRRSEATIAGICGIFLFLAAGVPYLLMLRVMAPLSRLDTGINRFRHGDLQTQVEVTSNDEMGKVATGFNSMTHALAENIGERRRAEEMVRDSEDKLRLLLESTAEAIYGLDLQGCCTFCNPACLRLLGRQHADELLGKNMHELIHHSRSDGKCLPVEECRIHQAFKTGLGCHVEDEVLWKADGTSFPAEYWSYPQRKGGETVGAVVTFINITERREAEAKIQSLAYYDTLTGLPNRVLLQDRLGKALARARRQHEKVAVLFLDLDGFKVINDSLGHSVGDVVLKHVAERLQTCAREQDTVARLGGDEFVVVLTGIKEVSAVGIAAERIRKALTAEFVVLEHALHVSCSLGVSLFPDHASDGETLVKHADAAMYRAKDSGRNNVQFFTADMNAEVMERLMLENSLRRAQEKNELYLMYQPQVDIATGEMVGTEALIRWQHPELGLIEPDKFIPIAENSGLIVQIGEWVLRTACAQAKQWQQEGLPAVPVAVNVSAVQFRQTGFVELVRAVLRETGLAPQFLELEITESLILFNADVMVAVFRKLNEMGVKLSIDDFGTGYSSLAYLKHYPIYRLKIDRSFVRDLAVDPDDAAITGTIISMAKNLGMKVIAEGVEQQEQLAFLRSHDCDEAQGFFFSKPVLADALAGLRAKFLVNHDGPVFVAD